MFTGHNLTLIDKCLELGCSLSQKDQVGSTPLNLAEGRKYYDVIRWFQVSGHGNLVISVLVVGKLASNKFLYL